MPVLQNAKHEAVAQLAAQGIDQTHAYLTVYPKSSEEAARRSASALMTNPDVRARVQELTGKAAERATVSLAQAIERAWEIAQQDERDRVPATVAVINALKPDGPATPSQTLVLNGLSDAQIDAAIQRLSGRV